MLSSLFSELCPPIVWSCQVGLYLNKHFNIIKEGPLYNASHVRFVRILERGLRVPSAFSSPARGEFIETALYWAGVVSVRLGAIAEKKVSQHSCVWGSVWV